MPYDKFRKSKIVIRSLGDKHYPKIDSAPSGRISSWLVLEPYDFYHGGLSVILDIRFVAIDDDGTWEFVQDPSTVDETKYRLAKTWYLGRIPWRNIRQIDSEGDEYYSGPHLYCAFDIDGTPFEDFVAREMGDDYDWPLDQEKQTHQTGNS